VEEGASDEDLSTHSSFLPRRWGGGTNKLCNKERVKLFKYIEGKAKFVSSYEVAFCFVLFFFSLAKL
jgi:hypothetical protein